jgi:hypothetical protein
MNAALALPQIEVRDADDAALDPRTRLGDRLRIGKSGESLGRDDFPGWAAMRGSADAMRAWQDCRAT